MPRTGSKSDSKRAKNVRLLDSIKSFPFLLLGVLALLYTLLLLSVSAEVEAQAGAYHDTLVTYVALATVIVLGLSRLLRWSWPLYVEDTLIVIFAWALLSILVGNYTVCGDSTGGVASLQMPPPPLVNETEPDSMLIVHSLAASHIDETDSDLELWLQNYKAMATGCNAEAFNLFYSLLVLGVLLCAALSDLRLYWVSLFFRLATFLLLVVAVLIPTACNRYRLLEPNALILKVTLYFVIWYLNYHRRTTERVLENNYVLCARSLAPNLQALGAEKRSHQRLLQELEQRCATPVQLFERLDRLWRYLREAQNHVQQQRQRPTSHPRRRRIVNELDIESGDEDEQSFSDSGDDDEPAQSLDEVMHRSRLSTLKEQSREMRKLQRVNDAFYNDTWVAHWLSWKNRAYSTRLLPLLDLARTAWILFVCMAFLPLAALEALWLLWHIRLNETELQACAQMTELLVIYGDKRGDFSDYS